ncbi:MAG: hypothetical protein NUW24_00390 [Anaerolineae bacterium]|jgi:hypothetical protein|nr:hypothetical protein [Anaerolineae bacterium]MDH7472555.1 hypothetical protein [Anaerolineae bacterium]
MRAIVRRFDGLLRRAFGVTEFCDDPQCLLRVQLARCPRHVRLSDGAQLLPGEPVLMLHLWNEHVPPMGSTGPDLPWAIKAYRQLIPSLHRVATLVATDPRWAGIRAVGGISVLILLDSASSSARLMERLGFDVMPHPSGPLGRFGEFWENLYTWALMWAFNAPSLRRKHLSRLQRSEIWMSRQRLLERYGPCHQMTPPKSREIHTLSREA